MQYTLRNVPRHLDRALRQQARREDKSLNAVLLAALSQAMGLAGELPIQRDLSDIAGSWQGARKLDRILGEQRQIDPELWK